MALDVFLNSFEYIIKKIFKNHHCVKQRNATLELLKSSVLVAFSGALRIPIAAFLLNTPSNTSTWIAGGLVIYSVYTLDRTLGSEEDIINRNELKGSKKEVGLVVALLAFIVGSYILEKEGMLVLAFLPLVTGFLYSKGIKIGKYSLRLKGGMGAKNIVVGLAWGTFVVGLAGGSYSNHLIVDIVFMLVSVKVFINSAIDDFKDIEGDAISGLKTLPVSLGIKTARDVLIWLHMLLHGTLWVASFVGVIPYEPVIMACSFIFGLICIQKYATDEKSESKKVGLAVFKDGESTIILMLRAVVGAV